jgi:hypothetical protein
VVEGARLESVFTGNRNEGSNPSLTATQSVEITLFFEERDRDSNRRWFLPKPTAAVGDQASRGHFPIIGNFPSQPPQDGNSPRHSRDLEIQTTPGVRIHFWPPGSQGKLSRLAASPISGGNSGPIQAGHRREGTLVWPKVQVCARKEPGILSRPPCGEV